MDATVEDAKTWIDNGWKKSDIIPDFLHVEGDASTICVLSHDLAAADNQTVASFTHTDVNNCIIRKEKNVFDRAEKTDFYMEEACAIDDTGKDYQEYVIRISYDKAYDAVKENIFLQVLNLTVCFLTIHCVISTFQSDYSKKLSDTFHHFQHILHCHTVCILHSPLTSFLYEFVAIKFYAATTVHHKGL